MNILSIDIDYAYSPTISLYDDFVVGSSITPEEQIDRLKKSGLPMPSVNPEKFSQLKNVVSKHVTKKTKIFSAANHHAILDSLPTLPLNIYNIDHHHDIFYPGWHDREKLDEGNWVSHVPNLLSYTWFRNLDSENLDQSVSLNFDYKELYLNPETNMPDFDVFFCCFSPHWTGPSGKKYTEQLLGVLR